MNKQEKKAYMIKYRKEHSEALKAWRKRYYYKNKEREIQHAIKWIKEHPEQKIISDRKYHRSEKGKLNRKKNFLLNRDKVNAWKRAYRVKKIKTDPTYKMRSILTNRIYAALKRKYLSKAYKSRELIGASIPRLRQHLESQFKPGMSWQNQGKWHIDHIRPLSSFDLSKPSQQKKACYYKNLQPLWAFENLSKGAKYTN